MGTLLHDLSLVHHDNPMGILDRGEAVGNNEGSTPLHQMLNRLLNQLFHLRIQGRGGFVENQNRRSYPKVRRQIARVLRVPIREVFPNE